MYPVALELTGRTCVLVGGGAVATRKIADLLDADAKIIVISPVITAALQELVAKGQIHWVSQSYRTGSLKPYNPLIVIAATDRPEVNRQVATEARAMGALVNIADSSAASDFHNMTSLHRPPLTVAIHTDGTSPALAHYLREVIDDALGDEYTTLADWLGGLRPQITQQITSQSQRKAFYRAVIHSDALTLLQQGQTEAAYEQLQTMVQEWTCAP